MKINEKERKCEQNLNDNEDHLFVHMKSKVRKSQKDI